MKNQYKTIRVSQETYEQLIDYRADLERINRARVSFNEAIDLLFGEAAGLDHEVASLKIELAGSKT